MNHRDTEAQRNPKTAFAFPAFFRASVVGLGHDSDHDGSTTYSGINTKNITITDREKQQSLTGKSVEETIAAYTEKCGKVPRLQNYREDMKC